MTEQTAPKKYRKKPVEITAMQWDGTAEGATPIINWIIDTGQRSASYYAPSEWGNGETENTYLVIGTLEYYPCKPDIFAATYDPVITVST